MTITSITKLPSGKTGATITSNLDELAILRGLVVNALRHMPDVGETTSTRQRLKAMSRVLHRVYTVDQLIHIDTNAPDYKSKCDALRDQLKDAKWKSTSWLHGRAEKNKVEVLYEHLLTQGQDGTWNCNPYMMGLYNGLELAIATLESREPCYRDKPDTGWLDDKLPAGLADPSPATLDAQQEGNTRAQVKNAIECLKTAGCNSILKGMPDRFTFQEFTDRVTEAGIATDHEARKILVSLLNGSKEWMADPEERTVVKKVGVVHRKPLYSVLFGMARPFARTHFIDEALDHGYTADEATKWLTDWLVSNPDHELDAATDTVHRRGVRPQTLIWKYGGTPIIYKKPVLPGVADPKSIPNPDYVSPAVVAHPDNSTDLKQASVPEEDRSTTTTDETPPRPPTVRTTLFEVYYKMDPVFSFATISTEAAEYGHDRPKVFAFVTLMCKIGSLRQTRPTIYEKLSNVRESEIRHLASLIA